jgi:hypothetical protein
MKKQNENKRREGNSAGETSSMKNETKEVNVVRFSDA